LNRAQHNHTHHTPPHFELSQSVTVPAEVHAARQASIVGREYGSSYSRKNNNGWVYYIAFAFGGQAWEVTEQELSKWQEQGSK
jgi:hypothetical protein